MSSGLAAAALAYAVWGLFPLYFHVLAGVDAFEVVLHRSLWSFVFVWLVLLGLRRWQWFGRIVREPGAWLPFAGSALLLSVNWLVYVWAVNHGHVLDASLGYFVTPLVNVMLGTWVLGERPRRGQWVAIALAAAGVVWLTATLGHPPWIALALAASFGSYGLLRKTASLGALEGLALETLIIAPVAVLALALIGTQRGSVFAGMTGSTVGWLLVGGPLTAVPLLLFAYGARRITLGTLGVLQYLAPTLQFALGRWWFHEPLAPQRLVGFVMIWSALALYTFEGVSWMRRQRASAARPVGG